MSIWEISQKTKTQDSVGPGCISPGRLPQRILKASYCSDVRFPVFTAAQFMVTVLRTPLDEDHSVRAPALAPPDLSVMDRIPAFYREQRKPSQNLAVTFLRKLL